MSTPERPSPVAAVLLASGLAVGLGAQQGPTRGINPGAGRPSPGASATTAVAPQASRQGSPIQSLPQPSTKPPIRKVPSVILTPSGPIKGTAVVLPPATERWTLPPKPEHWAQRDILRQIMSLASLGSIPVSPLPTGPHLEDHAWIPAGWRAYGLLVPAKGQVKVTLSHPHQAWFQIRICNLWGSMEEGMNQSLVPPTHPSVAYHNSTDKAKAVYFVVDDPGWMSSASKPYVLSIQRSWSSQGTHDPLPLIQGIWVVHQPALPSKSPAPQTVPVPQSSHEAVQNAASAPCPVPSEGPFFKATLHFGFWHAT